MAEKNKKIEDDYFGEKVIADEMQRTLSFELEHKCFRIWYVLNMAVMFIVYAVFMGDSGAVRVSEVPKSPSITPAMQVIIMLFYVVMLFSLSLYNYRAAKIGVLDAFASRHQKGIGIDNNALEGEQRPNIKLHMLSTFSLVMPASGLGYPSTNCYFKFFLVWLILAFTYEMFTIFCVNKNKKVRDSLAADDGNEEE